MNRPPTFYETVISSPQWKAWEVEQARRFKRKDFKRCYDMAEVVECGWISQDHFKDFLKFTNRKRRKP